MAHFRNWLLRLAENRFWLSPAEGVSRKLACVEIEDESLGCFNDGAMLDTFPIHAHNKHIGKVTSACHSPRLDTNIGYAMVPIEYNELGTEFEVETQHGRRAARVVEKPFWDPNKAIPKG